MLDVMVCTSLACVHAKSVRHFRCTLNLQNKTVVAICAQIPFLVKFYLWVFFDEKSTSGHDCPTGSDGLLCSLHITLVFASFMLDTSHDSLIERATMVTLKRLQGFSKWRWQCILRLRPGPCYGTSTFSPKGLCFRFYRHTCPISNQTFCGSSKILLSGPYGFSSPRKTFRRRPVRSTRFNILTGLAAMAASPTIYTRKENPPLPSSFSFA